VKIGQQTPKNCVFQIRRSTEKQVAQKWIHTVVEKFKPHIIFLIFWPQMNQKKSLKTNPDKAPYTINDQTGFIASSSIILVFHKRPHYEIPTGSSPPTGSPDKGG